MATKRASKFPPEQRYKLPVTLPINPTRVELSRGGLYDEPPCGVRTGSELTSEKWEEARALCGS